MKSTPKLFVLFLSCFLLTGTMAQVPQSFSYQAVVRDNAGNLIQNDNVSFRFTIRESSPAGTIIYRETHSPITNDLGLVNMLVGQGTVVQGVFSSINWANSTKYLQVEMDTSGGSAFTDMATTQLLSVPYAFHSGTAGGAASGDLSGSYPAPVVSKINGSVLGNLSGASNGQVLKFNAGSWIPSNDNNSGGSVTSVGLSMPAGFSVSSSPVTTSGTLNVSTTLNGPLRGNGSGITTGTTNLVSEVNNVLRIVNGGTNATTALSGSSIMISNGTSIVQGLKGTTTTVLHGNPSGAPTFGPVSLTTDVTGILPESNLPSLAGDVTGAVNANSVVKLQGRNVSPSLPSNGQVLRYNSGSSQWEPQSIVSSGWNLTGNGGTIDGTHFLGTTDATALSFRVNNQKAGRIDPGFPSNIYLGVLAGAVNVGNDNAVFGSFAFNANTSGSRNTAVGSGALYSSIAGYGNTAIGYYSQFNANSSASVNIAHNTSIGYYAMRGSTTPADNTGKFNTALGSQSLYNNSSGGENTATGYNSLIGNTTGNANTATGYEALAGNISGIRNSGFGHHALYSNSAGNENTAVGWNALSIQTSSGNTAVGYNAGSGDPAGDYNTFVGYFTTPNAGLFTNSTAIGAYASITASDQVRVGSSVTSIGGPVGWSTVSDARFKKNIKDYVHGLDFILKLKPVTYNYDVVKYSGRKKNYSEALEEITFSGFLAQDVEKLAASLGFEFSGVDAPKNDNDHYGLRYAEFVVPVIKAIQEQQAMIDAQQKIIDEMKQQNDLLKAALNVANNDINSIKLQLQKDTEASAK